MLSSIIRGRDNGQVHGLLACKQVDEFVGYKLRRIRMGRKQNIGTVHQLSDSFENSDHLDDLFGLVKFNQTTTQEIEREFKVAALSRDFRVNAFRPNGMNVRRVRGAHKEEFHRRRNTNRSTQLIYRGVAYGDVTNTKIKTDAAHIEIAYAGLIRGKTGEIFARAGDGGKPVVSSSKALLGFVVAANEDKTLMLTAEDISRDLNVEFLVPDRHMIPHTDDIRIRTRE